MSDNKTVELERDQLKATNKDYKLKLDSKKSSSATAINTHESARIK